MALTLKPTNIFHLFLLFLLLRTAAVNGSLCGRSASRCLAWRLSVESRNLKDWDVVPSKCVIYVEKYMVPTGGYWEDSRVAVLTVIEYALSLTLLRDGKDAWVFDIGKTLLSNIPYYQWNEYG